MPEPNGRAVRRIPITSYLNYSDAALYAGRVSTSWRVELTYTWPGRLEFNYTQGPRALFRMRRLSHFRFLKPQ